MEKLFNSRQTRHYIFDAIPLESTFPYLYIDLARKQLFFPPGKGLNKRNASSNSERWRTFQNLSELSIFCSTDDINQYLFSLIFH